MQATYLICLTTWLLSRSCNYICRQFSPILINTYIKLSRDILLVKDEMMSWKCPKQNDNLAMSFYVISTFTTISQVKFLDVKQISLADDNVANRKVKKFLDLVGWASFKRKKRWLLCQWKNILVDIQVRKTNPKDVWWSKN